jgi:hypothetical protein
MALAGTGVPGEHRLIFPVYQERGGATRSKFVKNVWFFSQLRFKARDIGGLGIDRQYYGRLAYSIVGVSAPGISTVGKAAPYRRTRFEPPSSSHILSHHKRPLPSRLSAAAILC